MRVDGFLGGQRSYSSIRKAYSGATVGFGNGSLPEAPEIIRSESRVNTAALASMRWQNTETVSVGWGGLGYSVPGGTTMFLYVTIGATGINAHDTWPG